jgi:hypothetical protein
MRKGSTRRQRAFVSAAAVGLAAWAGAARVAGAAEIVSLVGDKDGFGVPGAPAVPADGTLYVDQLGGTYQADYRTASDTAAAPFTDFWDTFPSVSYTHAYALGGQAPVSASLLIQIAGIHDINPEVVYPVTVNGVPVGTIPVNAEAGASQMVRLYRFDVPVNLLTGSGSVVVTTPSSSGGSDGYIVNFSELTITVPEPSSVAAPTAAAVAVVMAGSRRRRPRA